MKSRCAICSSDSRLVSRSLSVCLSCIRGGGEETGRRVSDVHGEVRSRFGLSSTPPKSISGIPCKVCSNECVMGAGEYGYCGLRRNVGGRLVSRVGVGDGLLYAYLDPHVTNCCASWFCPATGAGYPKYAYRPGPEWGYYNLAIFFYGCNFDCLFCQNSSHKLFEGIQPVSPSILVDRAVSKSRVSCWCFFGGSPEPQLPFAVESARRVLEEVEGERILRICFEWNGCGNRFLVKRAAEAALRSGGNLKFDLKAFDEDLSLALSGVSNRRAYENFEMIYREFYGERRDLPLLNATTLLVPGYIDEVEVGRIAEFLGDLDRGIPYSLLVFHPEFMMRDLPVSDIKQVVECYRAARRHLDRVHVGNLPTLGYRSMKEFLAEVGVTHPHG